MDSPSITPGSILLGPLWTEPIRGDMVEDMGDYVRIVGATERSRHRIDQCLSRAELRFLGAARVAPAPVAAEMVSDPNIERAAMQVALAYERSQGRVPEDVSRDNLGFDIRSRAADGRQRYIEVKGRADAGAVALTRNERFKAQRFGDEYFLYVVFDAATPQPTLYRIQNPAAHLKPEERMDVRCLVSVDAIRAHALE